MIKNKRMHYPSTKLIDLHKYLVGLKLIDPFIENQSYDTGSHLDDLREGNWFKNLPNEFPISRDLFLYFALTFFIYGNSNLRINYLKFLIIYIQMTKSSLKII